MTFGMFVMRANQAPGPASPVVEPGALLSWDGADITVENQAKDDQTSLYSLLIFDGSIYTGTGPEGHLLADAEVWNPSSLLDWNGTTLGESATVASNQARINDMIIFDDALFAATSNSGNLLQLSAVTATRPSLLEWNGTTLTTVANVTSNQVAITSFSELSGALYASTGNSGNLLEYT